MTLDKTLIIRHYQNKIHPAMVAVYVRYRPGVNTKLSCRWKETLSSFSIHRVASMWMFVNRPAPSISVVAWYAREYCVRRHRLRAKG